MKRTIYIDISSKNKRLKLKRFFKKSLDKKIKWTAMMLPEHVKILRDWAEEDTFEQKPELDEQQIEEMNGVLCQAMEEGREIIVTHYEAKHHKLLLGAIHHYDNLQGRLHIIDKFGEVHYIPINTLVDLRFSD